jgi:hypothetical protein
MRLVLFNGEKDINDLVARVFNIQGTDAKSAAKAKAALLKANPQLSNLSKISPGTVITVPDNAPAIAPEDQSAASFVTRSATGQAVQAAADALQQRLTDLETDAAARITAVMTRIQAANLSDAAKTVSGQNPELVKQLPDLNAVVASARSLAKDVQAVQTTRKQSLGQVTSVLASFGGKSGP